MMFIFYACKRVVAGSKTPAACAPLEEQSD